MKTNKLPFSSLHIVKKASIVGEIHLYLCRTTWIIKSKILPAYLSFLFSEHIIFYL